MACALLSEHLLCPRTSAAEEEGQSHPPSPLPSALAGEWAPGGGGAAAWEGGGLHVGPDPPPLWTPPLPTPWGGGGRELNSSPPHGQQAAIVSHGTGIPPHLHPPLPPSLPQTGHPKCMTLDMGCTDLPTRMETPTPSSRRWRAPFRIFGLGHDLAWHGRVAKGPMQPL